MYRKESVIGLKGLMNPGSLTLTIRMVPVMSSEILGFQTSRLLARWMSTAKILLRLFGKVLLATVGGVLFLKLMVNLLDSKI